MPRAKTKKQMRKEDELLTPASQAEIVRAVRLGNYLEVAAALAGVSRAILTRWMRTGAVAKDGKFREFFCEITKALAEAEVADLATIKKASQTQWQAAAWRLERRFKDRWGRQLLEVSGKDGGAITMENTAIATLITKIYGESKPKEKPSDK